MLNLYNRAEPIDLITVKSELETMGKLSKVGGFEYLAELPEKVPTTANATKYIKIVEEKSVLRNLIKTANEIIDNMREGIIALELGGGSVDIVSGHFVFNIALGGYVRNGEIVSILPPCLLEGNVLKTLNSISEIGNDLEFKFAKCVKDGQELDVSYGCPTIKLESQQIFF